VSSKTTSVAISPGLSYPDGFIAEFQLWGPLTEPLGLPCFHLSVSALFPVFDRARTVQSHVGTTTSWTRATTVPANAQGAPLATAPAAPATTTSVETARLSTVQTTSVAEAKS